MEKREIRTYGQNLAIREAENGESRTITGTAIVFNAEGIVKDCWGESYREVIKPEAATAPWLRTQDIKLNLLHERKDTIGRSREGKGNLRISVDGKGVNFEVDVPKCDIGDRALELVRAGVYTGCSFEFIPDQYEVEERSEDKQLKVTHKKFKSVTAFTLAMDPVYQQTEVSCREMRNETPEAKREEEAAARKAEEDAKREAEEKERILAREREKSAAARRMRQRDIEETTEMINYK